MLSVCCTRLNLASNSLVMVVTNWPTVSATSAIAVATNIHGKTSARLYDSAVLGKVLNGVSTVDALLSLAAGLLAEFNA